MLSEQSEKNWRDILMDFPRYLSVIEKAVQVDYTLYIPIYTLKVSIVETNM